MKTKLILVLAMIMVIGALSAQSYYNMQYTWQEIEAAITALRDTIPGVIENKLDNGVKNIQIEANSGINILVDMPVAGAPENSAHGYMFALDGSPIITLSAPTVDGDSIGTGRVTINTETPDPGYALTISGMAIADRWDVSGADFAEYFGTAATLPLGISVVIDRGRIREASYGEVPFGVTSSGAGFVGNTGRASAPILMSAVGDTLFQDVQYCLVTREIPFTGKSKSVWMPLEKVKEIPEKAEIVTRKVAIKNPEYGKEYIQRRNDPGYQLVGLIGQIPIRKGQIVDPQWVFIRELDQECDLWLVK